MERLLHFASLNGITPVLYEGPDGTIRGSLQCTCTCNDNLKAHARHSDMCPTKIREYLSL